MNSKKDKRKANRIQGGWGKSADTKKEHNKEISENESFCKIGDMAPKFDDSVSSDLVPKCKFFEISKNEKLDINLKLESKPIKEIPSTIELINNFISEDESASLFDYFLNNLPWEQRENTTPSGEKYLEPRQTCWYGLPYSYSKVKMPPNQNWDPKLLELLDKLQPFAPNKQFNSVMCNLYMTAKNSIDWHADDEISLGKEPIIASLTFGCTRAFELCLRSDLFEDFNNKSKNIYRSRVKDEPPFDGCSILYRVFLNSGSLLLMSGSVQDYWLHRVPKEYHDQQPRINFTFRHIIEG